MVMHSRNLGNSSPEPDCSKPPTPCAFCGATVPGGTEGCRELFHEVLALEYSDPAYGAAHLLTVDAYALQHSEDHGPRSNAFHLLHLCVFLEHGGDPGITQNLAWFQAQFERDHAAPFLEPPPGRGEVTIADVHGAANPDEHAERLLRWVQSVWEAWSAYHEWARQWLRER